MEDLNNQLTEYDLSFKKYIKRIIKLIYNKDNVIEKDNIENLICPICFYILKDPISCSNKKNAHSFCKECIDQYLKEKNKCPICKQNFEYKINNELNDSLKKLSFECLFQKEGCKDILPYSEYLNHINNCKYDNNIEYECIIKKFNYHNKEFEICGFVGNKIKIEQHFKICGLSQYKCFICGKNILQMDIEDHFTNECKIRYEKYPNGDIYIGEKKNNLKEGFGLCFYSTGGSFIGQFKNGMKEGFGVEKYFNRDNYIGEFKNDLREGIGIYSSFNQGSRYQGEFKNGLKHGYGIQYFPDGIRYEGEFKNNHWDGYGFHIFSDGNKYIGEFKNCYKEGFGIQYFSDGAKYIGMFNKGEKEGNGILYYPNGDKYKGNFKNEKSDGYGILYLSDGAIYEGEFKNNYLEGYGIFKGASGDKYEGEFKKSKRDGIGKIFFPEGDIYEGEFKNNMEIGCGILYCTTGERIEGEFINGKFYSHFKLINKIYRENYYFELTIFDIIYYLILILIYLFPRLIRNKISILLIIILILVILIN